MFVRRCKDATAEVFPLPRKTCGVLIYVALVIN